jgi:tRNA pseudouridine38-40 synthase
MPTFKITVAYDGAPFVGWQRQAEGTSIQGLIEDALKELDGREVTVTGAGRTDAGVHALAQVASFTLVRDDVAPEVIVRSLNAKLPQEIRVRSAEPAPASFHARFDAKSKRYRYRLWTADVLNPFEREYVWHVPGALDIAAMAQAARLVEGRHDFAAFQTIGGAGGPTERAITLSRITSPEPRDATTDVGLVEYEIEGDGFLRHMVRAIVGTLMEVGRGRHHPEWIRDVIASRDRAQAGRTAPAHGLFLVRVDYGVVQSDPHVS